MALYDYFNTGATQPQQVRQGTGADQVAGSLQSFLSPSSDYIRQARQAGAEYAAERGGVNSSIAAGASQRAAIQQADSLAQQANAIDQNRQSVLDNDWLSEQNFGRTLFSQKFGSSLDMLNNINQMALMDPELYTPEVASGLSNFFSQNMNNILKQYFNG